MTDASLANDFGDNVMIVRESVDLEKPIDISIIIVTYNSKEDIGPCLDSIVKTKGALNLEFLMVDNASKDNTVSFVHERYPFVKVLVNDTNRGFPAANNQAIGLARAQYILLLNPDTIALPGLLMGLKVFMDQEVRCGICGPIQVSENRKPWPEIWDPSLSSYLLQLTGLRCLRKNGGDGASTILSGSCLLIRSSTFKEVGFLDEDLFWCEDADLCLRAKRAGYLVARVSGTQIIHKIGKSAKSNMPLVLECQYTSKIKFLKKHFSITETRIVGCMLMIQALARLTKWTVVYFLSSSEIALTRIMTLKRILFMLPRQLKREKLDNNRARCLRK